jgi:hypothetical protein
VTPQAAAERGPSPWPTAPTGQYDRVTVPLPDGLANEWMTIGDIKPGFRYGSFFFYELTVE